MLTAFVSYGIQPGPTLFDKEPLLIWTLIASLFIGNLMLLALNLLLPPDWFWPVYAIQVSNLAGAAGDIYVTWRMWHMPADVLVQDSGTAMNVYGRR